MIVFPFILAILAAGILGYQLGRLHELRRSNEYKLRVARRMRELARQEVAQ